MLSDVRLNKYYYSRQAGSMLRQPFLQSPL
jgi:hypothetical protein